jgi:hypothetical protein
LKSNEGVDDDGRLYNDDDAIITCNADADAAAESFCSTLTTVYIISLL